MKNGIDQKIGFVRFGGMSFICLSLLSACSEDLPTTSSNPEKSTPYMQINGDATGVSNRVAGVTDSVGINEVFGAGYVTSNSTTESSNLTNAIGNTGGFGFNGSIASIVANLGGFGFGGFGTFASFFAGSLPSSPPGGILIPPGVGAPPNSALPPGGFGPPPGTFTTPPGGFVPPGIASGVPPGLGAGVGGGIGLGVGNGAGNGGGVGTGGIPANALVTTTNSNLTELQTPLANIDLDILLVSPINNAGNSGIAPRALTETIVPCAGGGTRTQIVDDVDPVGLSTGDTRSTVYVDCVRNVAGTNITNGSRGFTTDEVIGFPFIDASWVSRSTMFRNNFVQENTASGRSRTTDGSTTTGISVTDNNLISQQASGSGNTTRTTLTSSNSSNFDFNLSFNWDVAAQVYDIVFNVNVESINTTSTGSNVVTNTPISGILGQAPNAGQLTFQRLTDAVVVSVVTATAQADGSVLVEVDNNADGVVDTSAVEVDWSGVLFSIFNG